MSEKSPAFQFYAADFLADENVALMSLTARGAYITLMCFCWREGSIPSDPERIARLCGVDSSAMNSYIAELLQCFEIATDNPDRLVHPRLEEEREKQESHRKERQEAGQRGAKARWNKKLQQNGSAIKEPMAEPMAKNASSSSTSTSIIKKPSVSRRTDSPEKKSRQPDPFYETFTSAYSAKQASPYVSKNGDFVQMANCRKACGEWLTVDEWAKAVRHYFDSELGEFTLADLAVRFGTFYKSALDRFKQPMGNGLAKPEAERRLVV